MMNHQLDILLIDKSFTNCLLVDKIKSLGCDVDFIEDETGALQKACEHKYDIIFTNVEIRHKNSGIQLVSLIRQHAEINKDTPIYALDMSKHSEYVLHSKSYGFISCIPWFNKKESMLYIKEIINNQRLANNHRDKDITLSDSNKDFLLAKTLELMGNSHVLLIGAASQSAEETIKLFANSPCDIDVAFNYDIAKNKLALNAYDFILINLDTTDLELDRNLVYFIRNFSTKNHGTTIFGFSAENSDEYNEDVRFCTHINHIMDFPFTAEDIELMIKFARWKIDATFHQYTLQNSITPDRS